MLLTRLNKDDYTTRMKTSISREAQERIGFSTGKVMLVGSFIFVIKVEREKRT